MSNVVHIELDRKNRVYRTGEVISGTVVVDGRVGQRARRVVLRTWWATRGKGTSTRGGKAAAILHEGSPPQGPEHRHAFHFVAPDAPFTYVGKHLAIEHHLQAVVELPMAPDLKVEEAFVLTPGGNVSPAPQELLEAVEEERSRPEKRPVAAIGLLLAVFGVFTLPFPGILLLAVGLIALGVGLRKELASSRVGDVSVEVEPRVVSPGDEVSVRVGIFPKQPVQVQGITARLRAQEICESQSGNNRKRHRHLGHDEPRTLLGSTVIPGELRREVSATFVVPALGMWSFKAPRNQIRWEVEVVVRIPSWPDWKQTVPIVVWPAKVAIPGAGKPALPSPPAPSSVGRPVRLPPRRKAIAPRREATAPLSNVDAPEPRPERPRPVTPPLETPVEPSPAAADEPSRPARSPAPPEPPPPAGSPASDDLDFAAAVESILETRRYTPERVEKVTALLGRSVDARVVIDRVDRPFGRTRQPGFEGGRVVRGRLAESDLEVEVHVPTDKAATVDGLGRGDAVAVSGRVASWERLPERPVIRLPVDDLPAP